MKNQKLKGNALLFLAAFIWGTSFIAQSKGVELISPAAFIAVRSLLGAFVLLPVILILDFGKKRSGKTVLPFDKTLCFGGLICGVILCFASTVQTIGMVYTSPGKAGFITALYMIFVPIVGLFRRHKPRPILLMAVLLAVAGLYMTCIGSDFTVNKGDLIELVCALLFAAHILAVNYFSPKVDGVKLSFLQFLVCGLLNLVYILIFEHPSFAPIWDCRLSICYSGILSSGVAYTLQIVGQKHTDPISASILMSLESVFSVLATEFLILIGWSLTGGAMTAKELIGCVLMFAATILVQLPEKHPSIPLEK